MPVLIQYNYPSPSNWGDFAILENHEIDRRVTELAPNAEIIANLEAVKISNSSVSGTCMDCLSPVHKPVTMTGYKIVSGFVPENARSLLAPVRTSSPCPVCWN